MANASRCEFWRLVRCANNDKAFVVCRIINAIRNCHSICIARIIAFQNIQLLSTVGTPRIFEIANQFALFRIYGYRRKADLLMLLPLPYQIMHLTIAI